MVDNILIAFAFSSIGLALAILLTWVGLVSFANVNLSPFSFMNALTTLGVLFMYNSSVEVSGIRDFLIYIAVSFFFHVGRLSTLLENEDKRLRVFFLSSGYTKNEYVLNYLFKRAIRKNITSLFSCWGLFTLILEMRHLEVRQYLGFWIGLFLLCLGVTSSLLDRKN
ncbi:hypothetical protein [Pseudothermotoga sp.]|nr:hypothetical protein [Pseudothermotoga sp.]MCX7812229.1 hypothetical protein [Pseudothermotoga sp.]MDW8139299.1 hypothetical protein [Pseudothermotoga sp.]